MAGSVVVEYSGDSKINIVDKYFSPDSPYNEREVPAWLYKQHLRHHPDFSLAKKNTSRFGAKTSGPGTTAELGVLIPNQRSRYEDRWAHLFPELDNYISVEVGPGQGWRKKITDVDLVWSDGSIHRKKRRQYISRKNIPLVVTLRGLFWTARTTHSFKQRYWDILSMASAIILLSRYCKTQLAQKKPRLQAKLHVIPNGVPLVGGGFPKRSAGRPSAPFRLLTVTNFAFSGKRRGVKRAVASLNSLSPTVFDSLVIIGNNVNQAPNSFLRSLKQMDDRINIRGEVSRRSLMNQMRRSDLFVYGSYKDCQPSVIMEAMASGLPVLANNDLGFGTFVEQGKAGYVTSFHDFSTRLSELADDRGKLNEMSRYAAQVVRQKYDWSRVAGRYEEVFNQVVG